MPNPRMHLEEIFLIVIISTCLPAKVLASQSFGCESVNKMFNLSDRIYEGDGWNAVFDDIQINYNGKQANPGLFNWFKSREKEFSFTVYSVFGRQVHINAREEGGFGPTGEGLLYKVLSGFVVIDGATIDLTNMDIECGGG